MRVGVVSDTHGYFNPRLPGLLEGVEHILHAGDICGQEIIESLEAIAPVTAVRGNNDRQGPTSLSPEETTLELGGCSLFLTHQVKVPKNLDSPDMDVYRQRKVQVVVFGHSHIACQELRGDILFFNPGAAGKRRFNTVPSIGILELDQGIATGTILPL